MAAPTYTGPAIDVVSVTKDYGKTRALDDVSLQVRSGELFGLIGPNGAGKSTLMKSLIGALTLDKGKVRVMGMNPTIDSERIKTLSGIVPEAETPPSFLNPNEFMEFVMNVRGKRTNSREKEWWLTFFDMESQRDQIAKDLSKGTRQKLMLTSAFIHKPPLLLLDEPFINLDPIYQRKVKDHLLRYKEKGGTILLSTHILGLAQELCDRVAILHKGKILKIAPTGEMIRETGDLEEAFLEMVGYRSQVLQRVEVPLHQRYLVGVQGLRGQ